MRTTVTIDDTLLVQAKAIAAASARSLGDVVDDGLRLLIATRDRVDRRPVEFPTDGGSGLQPGVDLEDKARLHKILGDDELHAAR